jgi:hypothetical protein
MKSCVVKQKSVDLVSFPDAHNVHASFSSEANFIILYYLYTLPPESVKLFKIEASEVKQIL